MKKFLRPAFSLLLLIGVLTSSILSVHAEGIYPRYIGISMLTSSLTISSIGGATCTGMVSLRSGYTADLTVSLKQDGTTIKTWSTSGSGTFSSSNTYYVTSGHEYVVKTTATVYNSDGKIVEVQSENSLTKSY